MLRRSIVAAFLLLSLPVLAEEDAATAAAMFKAASAAFARGEYRAAATAFEEADRRAPRAAAIYNAALAWDEAGDRVRAADAYARALARDDLAKTSAARSRERLTLLEKDLAIVDVVAPAATITLAHATRAAPTRVYLSPGSYEITVTWPDGSKEKRALHPVAGVVTVTFDPPVSKPPEPIEKPIERPLAKVEEPSRAQQTFGIVLVAGGVGAAGAAVFLGVRALAARDDFDASAHTDRTARDRAATLRTWTNVAWASAAALGATGAILILTAPRGSTSVVVGLGEVGLRVAF